MFRVTVGILIAALVAGCLYATLFNQQWGFDDAFISYRYAANLVDGHGLVFNPGERVEGYSNFLYVLVMAAGLCVVPHANIYAFSVTINILCLATALWVLASHLRSLLGDARALIAALLFALSPSLWLAAWAGMETCMALLIFVAAWCAVTLPEGSDSRSHRSGLALVLAMMGMVWIRADGFVMAAIFAGFLVVSSRFREALIGGGAALAATALHFGGRLWYYEDFLPNTYYVKVTGDLLDRLAYAWDLFRDFVPLMPYIALLILVALLVRRPQPGVARLLRFGGVFAATWLAYWFYIGGDIFEMRFLLVLLPLGFAAFVERLPEEWPTTLPARLALAAALLVLVVIPFHRLGLQTQITRYDPWTTLGVFLGERYPNALVAVDGAGKIPYFSGLETIDMLGLADPHIAHLDREFHDPGHSKFDADYVYSRKPAIITSRVRDSRMNLFSGLRRKRYQEAGYEIAYLMHLGPTPTGPPLVEYQKIPENERMSYLMDGYGYAVLLERSLLEKMEPLPSDIP